MDKGATDDEDLRVEIDDFKFPKLENPNRYFDSPAAFSGGELHNHLKTVYFVLHLNQGKHTLSLIPDKSALVKKVEVQEMAEFPNFTLNLEEQAEKGNGRPWMTFVLVGVGLKSFTIKATVNWKFPDGDDIKIVVDGKTKRNWLSILHQYWIFASSIFWKIFGKETIERTFEENLPKANLHYLEIWVDETPTVHFIELELETSTEKEAPPAIQKIYQDGIDPRSGRKLW